MGFRSRILPTGSQSADSNNISAFYQRWMKLFRPFFAKLQFHRHAIGKNAARQFLGSWVLICDILQGMGVVCVYVCVCVVVVVVSLSWGTVCVCVCVCVCVWGGGGFQGKMLLLSVRIVHHTWHSGIICRRGDTNMVQCNHSMVTIHT